MSDAMCLPTSGPVILATNADNLDACLSVLSATDRTTRFILVQTAGDKKMSWFARRLAGRDMLAVVRGDKPVDWNEVARKTEEALQKNEVVGLPLDAAYPPGWLERYPLTAADLAQEAVYLKAAKFKLKFS